MIGTFTQNETEIPKQINIEKIEYLMETGVENKC